MSDITGAKLITSAYLFGVAAFAFSTIPFLVVILNGIMRGREHTTGGINILNIVFMAFFVHTFSVLFFMVTIKILDQIDVGVNNYYSTKVFQIFWSENKTDALSAAGASDNVTIETNLAYSTLFLSQTVVKIFFMFLPIIVFLLSLVYGIYLGSKDTYRQDYIGILVYTLTTTIVISFLYIAWAMIGTEALFLQNNISLLEYISTIWKNQLGL